MSKKLHFGNRTYYLEVTATERIAFEKVNITNLDTFDLPLAAYVPAKETLEQLFQKVIEVEDNPELEGKSLMLDFCEGHPKLGIIITETKLYAISMEWLTNVYREDAIVKAIDTITGLDHTYVSSQWRKNSFYEWRF